MTYTIVYTLTKSFGVSEVIQRIFTDGSKLKLVISSVFQENWFRPEFEHTDIDCSTMNNIK